MVSAGDKILLAVSGGLDSAVMLHLFLEVKDALQLALQIVHVHHGLRGEEADADLDFVRTLAAQANLTLHQTKVDTEAFAASPKMSIEMAARELRYGYFRKVLQETGFDKLATAHTLNDQAETVTEHFLRGSGVAGMRGIPRKRSAYIRPLLDFSRAELADFAKANKLSFQEDTSNRNLTYQRNRIRHELLPLLQSNYNPQLISALGRSAEVFEEVENHLKDMAEKAYKSLVSLQKKNEIVLEINRFLEYTGLVQKYVMFHCCKILAIDSKLLTFSRLSEILHIVKRNQLGKKIELGDRFSVMIDRDGLVVQRGKPANLPTVTVDLLTQKTARFLDCEFHWAIFDSDRRPHIERDNRSVEQFDFDSSGHRLHFTPVTPGLAFHPLNFGGTKKVADFLSDIKAPIRKKNRVAVLRNSESVIWVCGYRLDDRHKVTEKTRRIIQIEMLESGDE